ncbi:MAG: hypothetical protein ABI543_10725 [Ignavibacteria bacterium]
MKIQKTIIGFCIIIFFILLTGTLCSQTPYYSLKFNITDNSPKDYIYAVKEHICKFAYDPVVPSGDY